MGAVVLGPLHIIVQQPYKVRPTISPILQRRRLRADEVV